MLTYLLKCIIIPTLINKDGDGIIMNILYVHGANSSFDKNNSRFDQFKEAGHDVVGISHNFTQKFDDIIESNRQICIDQDIDLIVGTSLGGLLASNISYVTGIPSIVVNPATNVNLIVDKFGDLMNSDVIASYNANEFKHDNVIYVLLGSEDDVINPHDTEQYLEEAKADVKLVTTPNADHRFLDVNIVQYLPHIEVINSCIGNSDS